MRPVSNESSSIIRMLGQLQMPGSLGVELYPQELQQQIDVLNDKVGFRRFSDLQCGSAPAAGSKGQLHKQLMIGKHVLPLSQHVTMLQGGFASQCTAPGARSSHRTAVVMAMQCHSCPAANVLPGMMIGQRSTLFAATVFGQQVMPGVFLLLPAGVPGYQQWRVQSWVCHVTSWV